MRGSAFKDKVTATDPNTQHAKAHTGASAFIIKLCAPNHKK